MESLSNRIKNLRIKIGLTQLDVANSLGIERSTYAYYELGRTVPNWLTLKKLSQIFDVDIHYLIDDDCINNGMKDNVCVPYKRHINHLDKNEINLISEIRSLSVENQKKIYAKIEFIVEDLKSKS